MRSPSRVCRGVKPHVAADRLGQLQLVPSERASPNPSFDRGDRPTPNPTQPNPGPAAEGSTRPLSLLGLALEEIGLPFSPACAHSPQARPADARLTSKAKKRTKHQKKTSTQVLEPPRFVPKPTGTLPPAPAHLLPRKLTNPVGQPGSRRAFGSLPLRKVTDAKEEQPSLDPVCSCHTVPSHPNSLPSPRHHHPLPRPRPPPSGEGKARHGQGEGATGTRDRYLCHEAETGAAAATAFFLGRSRARDATHARTHARDS